MYSYIHTLIFGKGMVGFRTVLLAASVLPLLHCVRLFQVSLCSSVCPCVPSHSHTSDCTHAYSWVVRKHSVNRLQRNFRPSLAAVVAAVCVQSTIALCLNQLDVVRGQTDSE